MRKPSIIGKYIFGRVAKPKPIRILKDGTLSRATNQDTNVHTYLNTCEEMGIEPDKIFTEHLAKRDRHAWVADVDWIMDEQSVLGATQEAAEIARRMRQEKQVPPRSPSSCRLCDWQSLCRSDPSGNISSWFGTQQRRSYSGAADVYHYEGGKLDVAKQFILSPSQMRSYMACPRQWYFSYKLQQEVAKPEWSKVSARTYGILVHEACAALGYVFSTPIRGVEVEVARSKASDLIEIATHAINAKIAKLSQHLDDEDQDWRVDECAHTAFRMFQRATRGIEEILEVEQRRVFRLPGTYTWVTCQPDLVAKDNYGNLVVIDYKTTNNQYLDRVSDNFLNHPAMFLYAHAVKCGHSTKGEFDADKNN